MKNLELLKEKLTMVSKEQMKSVQGGLKWTKDRSGNVHDTTNLDGWIKHQKSLSAETILFGHDR